MSEESECGACETMLQVCKLLGDEQCEAELDKALKGEIELRDFVRGMVSRHKPEEITQALKEVSKEVEK